MNSTSRNRDSDVQKAEQEAASAEAKLSAELARLESVAGEVLGRLQHVRAASAQLQLKGAPVDTVHQRVQGTAVPKLDLSAPAGDSLMARWTAVEARNRATEQARQLVHGYAAELSRLASQLNADEQELKAAEQAIRAQEETQRQRQAEETQRQRQAAIQAAQPAPPPPPPAAFAETIDVPRPGAAAPARPPTRPEGRREQGRVRMQAAIDVHSESNFFTGFSTNLSEGGLFVATVKALPLGSEVDLNFTLPSGRQITVQGVVRWAREVNDNTPEIFPGMGVQFQNLTPDAERAIHEFVQTREPMFFPD